MTQPPGFQEPASIGRKLASVNWMLIALVALIAAFGVVSLYSVARGSFSPFAERHALRAMLGLAVVLAMALVPLRFWLALAYPSYLIVLLALALVPLVGTEVMGAKRWLRFAGISLQPSEIMKVTLVLALARYYQWLDSRHVSRPQWVLVPCLMIAAPVLLVLQQPDLGTAVLFAAVGFALMFLSGVSPLYFIGSAGLGAALAPLLWDRLYAYQRQRILVFLDPELDPLGSGYHVLQSKIALGSGGLTGKGYLNGTQGQLNFLPEKETDFIFTMLGEEWGFIGAVTLIGLYALLVVMLLAMALACRSAFARCLNAGAALIVFVYAGVNISMVMGLAPVVGVPLPLVSYGGTAMTAIFAALGIAMCAYVNRSERLRRDDLRGLLGS